jgi:hypothetical protein
MTRRRAAVVALACCVGLGPGAGRAQFGARPVELVTARKTVAVRHRAGRPTTFVLRATLGGRARTLLDPSCPTQSTIEIALAAPPSGFASGGVVPLPCASWSRTRRGGWRFRGDGATTGGVTEIRYGPRRLLVRARGAPIDFVRGPVAYLETWLSVGADRRLVRLQDFKANGVDRIIARRPTKAGARGEAAFWDTVWGDDPRPADAFAALEAAVRRRPSDGRSQFLLGMMNLWALQDVDPLAPGPAGSAMLDAAQEHLDAAVELLPSDFRVPGFRAGLTYANGVAHDDQMLRDLGFARLEAAVAADPLFNSFDFFAIAPVFPVAGSSAFFQTWFVDLADVVLVDNLDCPATRPEVCGNVGMAPHNVEGTFVLLGDVYAKGGRPTDAEQWWALAKVFGESNGWAHLALLDDRIGHAAERAALYADGDPSNDPPFMDGSIGYCRFCHQK